VKRFIIPAFLLITLAAKSQPADSTLQKLLLSEFKTTYDVKDWFVPLNVAIDGISAEQANWTDSSGNHSVGQLAHHLLFWNERVLKQLRKEPVDAFDDNNDATFTRFSPADWEELKRNLDEVMQGYVTLISTANEKDLAAWASTLSHVSTHNAYHIGEMVIIRKLQGSWNPDKGVK